MKFRGNKLNKLTAWRGYSECPYYNSQNDLFCQSRIDASVHKGYGTTAVLSWLHCLGERRSVKEECVRVRPGVVVRGDNLKVRGRSSTKVRVVLKCDGSEESGPASGVLALQRRKI